MLYARGLRGEITPARPPRSEPRRRRKRAVLENEKTAEKTEERNNVDAGHFELPERFPSASDPLSPSSEAIRPASNENRLRFPLPLSSLPPPLHLISLKLAQSSSMASPASSYLHPNRLGGPPTPSHRSPTSPRPLPPTQACAVAALSPRWSTQRFLLSLLSRRS
jgi:hypothetical protein